MEKKYQIFISSTFEDLKEERAKIRDAILSMSHFPVGMEFFGAANESQWQIISDTIDSSDYYVLIIGTRYGSIIPEGLPDAGISYTEKEFRYAIEKGVPVLVFIINDNVPVKVEFIEKENPEKLESFKSFASKNRTVAWWSSSEDLAQKVTASLQNQMKRTERPGWIRGGEEELAECRAKIAKLTELNRQLENDKNALSLENQELKRKGQRSPKLLIALCKEPKNGATTDDSFLRVGNSLNVKEPPAVHLKVGSIELPDIKREYRPISKEDLPPELAKCITDEEISKYNSYLPSEMELDGYLNEYLAYHLIKEHGFSTDVVIYNCGNLKATEVSVTIEFPEAIHVLKTDEINNFSEPKPPRKPKDIRTTARGLTLGKGGAIDKLFAPLIQTPPSYSPISPKMDFIFPNIFQSVSVSNNIADIEIKEILHTKVDSVSGIYLVPLQKGKFEAKVTVMCAEYEAPEETTIAFECE